ncbi:hypothetical protein [Mycolicibacterium celeriflavum]|nr:hypothetical protein [Mycolicibacterium celeriflavum]MCV7237705.1 hypothetical protein [Mycolicibacterium celeriflavum]
MTQTLVDNDPATLFPPKCLRPGIWRHFAPKPDYVAFEGEECIWHVMVTSDAGPVIGQLVRWVSSDGQVGYEARIDGLEDSAGTCDAVAFDVDSLACLAFVANSLRHEWEIITDVYPDSHWTYDFMSRWPNEVYPNV